MRRSLWLMGIAVALTSSCAGEEQPMRIRCELSIPQAVTGAQPAELGFALTNEGSEIVHILSWQTPFEGIRAPMFIVMRDDIEVDYRGPMMKRAAPGPESYVELQPGERKEAKVDLGSGWDVSAAGSYTVEYVGELFDVVSGPKPASRAMDELKATPLSCAPVKFVRTP